MLKASTFPKSLHDLTKFAWESMDLQLIGLGAGGWGLGRGVSAQFETTVPSVSAALVFLLFDAQRV